MLEVHRQNNRRLLDLLEKHYKILKYWCESYSTKYSLGLCGLPGLSHSTT